MKLPNWIKWSKEKEMYVIVEGHEPRTKEKEDLLLELDLELVKSEHALKKLRRFKAMLEEKDE